MVSRALRRRRGRAVREQLERVPGSDCPARPGGATRSIAGAAASGRRARAGPAEDRQRLADQPVGGQSANQSLVGPVVDEVAERARRRSHGSAARRPWHGSYVCQTRPRSNSPSARPGEPTPHCPACRTPSARGRRSRWLPAVAYRSLPAAPGHRPTPRGLETRGRRPTARPAAPGRSAYPAPVRAHRARCVLRRRRWREVSDRAAGPAGAGTEWFGGPRRRRGELGRRPTPRTPTRRRRQWPRGDGSPHQRRAARDRRGDPGGRAAVPRRVLGLRRPRRGTTRARSPTSLHDALVAPSRSILVHGRPRRCARSRSSPAATSAQPSTDAEVELAVADDEPLVRRRRPGGRPDPWHPAARRARPLSPQRSPRHAD